MSNVGKIIYGKLSNTSGVTGYSSERIFPEILPQHVTLPAITYFQVSQEAIHASGKDPNLSSVRVQVSSWSTSAIQANRLSRETRKALMDYSGSTWVNTQRIFFDDETSLNSVDPESKIVTYQVAQDYIVWFST